MTSNAESFANIFNQTKDINIYQFFNNLNAHNKQQFIQTINEDNELNLMILEDYNVAEKQDKSKSEKVWCEYCEKYLSKNSIYKHESSNKHIKNQEEKEGEKPKKKYTKEELREIREALIRIKKKQLEWIQKEKEETKEETVLIEEKE